ncbi:MAG: helix-turn-helix domain-containing protein [Acidimicrobiales bacterium]
MSPSGNPGSERRHEPVFPGFKEMADRRRALAGTLAARRTEMGLSQTEVAARMGTSQSAVARLESGDADVRLSTLERYVAALGERLDWGLEPDVRHRAQSRAATRSGSPGGSSNRNPKGSTKANPKGRK